MVPKTVQIECPNGVKTMTRKKHVLKRTKIGKVSKNVAKCGPKKGRSEFFFNLFRALGSLLAFTCLPGPLKEAQCSFHGPFWYHFLVFFMHFLVFCGVFFYCL